MTEPEFFTTPVLGFRGWTPFGWVVVPRSVGDPWEPGVNKAYCAAGGMDWYRERLFDGDVPHEAPHEDCDCGFYAMHSFDDVHSPHRPGPDEVRGVIAGWGAMQVHHDGWRSEYARILAFEDNPRFDVQRLARTYKVPVVEIGELREFGLKYAQPLPASVIPEYKPTPIVRAGAAFGMVYYAQPATFTWSTTTVIPGMSGGR